MSSGTLSLSGLSMTSSWYTASANVSTVAPTTFERSLAAFKQKLTTSSKKRVRLDDLRVTRLDDFIDEVSRAQAHYSAKNEHSKYHKCIVAFSKRVVYYGKVMDVMVQHHPEYVSLVWGTLKIIFGSVVEHERLGTTIMTALTDIGDALFRIELAESLYPTEKMDDTIVTLNCYIISFLFRALDWYETSTVSRAIQSVTRPAALRYDDLIEDIRRTLGKVTDLSVAGSQAEQRDMHEELRQVRDAQDGFRADVRSRLDEMHHQLSVMIQQQHQERQFQAIHRQLQDLSILVQHTQQNQASTEQTILQEVVLMKQDIKATQVDIRHQLSDIQLTQALSLISSLCIIDHKSVYEHALLLRRVRKVSSAAKCTPFWNSQQLQSWDQSPSNSSIVLRATFRDRSNIRDFYINVIGQLLRSEIAVLWILQQKNVSHNVFDVLKSLVSQALSGDSFSHMDVMISSHIRIFNAAHSVNDYTMLLVDILTRFKITYMIIDIGAISSESVDECHRTFAAFPQLLSERSPGTVLKVMLVTHGHIKRDNTQGKVQDQMVIRIGQTSKRKGKRIPQAPLKGKPRSGLK